MHSSSASGTRELQSLMTRNPVIVDRDATLDEALALLEHYGIRHPAEPGTPLSHCAGRMLDHKISALPILEGERALGILTQRNVLEHFATVASSTASRSARERSESAEGERR